jgi:hypothetical protein
LSLRSLQLCVRIEVDHRAPILAAARVGHPARPTLPVVTVVCEDTTTAVAHLPELKREVKTKVTVRVEPAPHSGAGAEDVLNHGLELADALASTQPGDSTWVLLDTEAEAYKREQAQQAKKKAASRKLITVLLSNPCFEVWTLAHFVDTGAAFKNCAAVVSRVKAEWKKAFASDFGRKKGQADYSKLMPPRDQAVRNTKKREPEREGSWTEVYQVVEAISALSGA